MSRGRLLTAVLCGLAIGLVLALVSRPDRPGPPALAGHPAVAPDVPRLPPPERPGTLTSAVPGTVRTADLGADPRGREPWLARAFRVPRSPGGRGDVCIQIGRRTADGRFGWAIGDRPARAVERVSQMGAPFACLPVGRTKPVASIRTTTTISWPAGRPPRPGRTMVYGVLRDAGTRARVLDGGRPVRTVRLGSGFVAFTRPDPGPDDLRVELRSRGGERRILPAVTGRAPLTAEQRRLPRAVEADLRVAVRSPDPEGGLAWGVAGAPSTVPGFTCSSSLYRVLGRRLGNEDLTLGTLDPVMEASCVRRSAADPAVTLLLTAQPVIATGEAERLQRRTGRGRTTLLGQARPDVRVVELISPRDVRTLIPDPRTGVFVTVYEGGLIEEEIVAVATLRDGRSVRVVERVRD